MKKISTLFLFLFPVFFAFSQITPGYFMHPDVHDNTVVFVAEGDIWMASLTGGMATGSPLIPVMSPIPEFLLTGNGWLMRQAMKDRLRFM